MKLTMRHKMKDWDVLKAVCGLDEKFVEKVKAFDVPKKILGKKVKQTAYIQLQHIISAWDIKTEEDLHKWTAKAFGISNIKKCPIIDFIRLTIAFSDVAGEAGKLFMDLRRECKDSDLKTKLEALKTKHKSSILAEIMIASQGAYTQQQAAELPWMFAYDILERQTLEYDKSVIQSEEMEKKSKRNGRTKSA